MEIGEFLARYAVSHINFEKVDMWLLEYEADLKDIQHIIDVCGSITSYELEQE